MFSLLPGASCAVPWCPGISHNGQAPSSVGFSPVWCHRLTDFTQFLKEMVFQERSQKDLKLLGMLFCSAKHHLHGVSTSLLLEELLVRHFSVGRGCLVGCFSNLRLVSHLHALTRLALQSAGSQAKA